MRKEDLLKLETAYARELGDGADDRFADAMEVPVPRLRELADEILADFDEATFGVGWWAGNKRLGESRRILISDHLRECAVSVQTNLVEAKLHVLEFADAVERESHFRREAVKINKGGHVTDVRAPPRVKPADDLAERLIALHAAGFARAIGSALDCLAGTIVGVVGLKTSLLKADLGPRFKETLQKLDANDGPGTAMQAEFARAFEDRIAAAGPEGWIDWVVDFRNMLVHRGRRLQLASIEPRGRVIFDSRENPIVLVKSTPQLPRDPARSDVEVLLSDAKPVLEESAEVTMRGSLTSSVALVEATSVDLASVWRARRKAPDLIEQPREQWKDGAAVPSSPFVGYDAGKMPFDPKQMNAHSVVLRRLRSAALVDELRPRWKDFK